MVEKHHIILVGGLNDYSLFQLSGLHWVVHAMNMIMIKHHSTTPTLLEPTNICSTALYFNGNTVPSSDNFTNARVHTLHCIPGSILHTSIGAHVGHARDLWGTRVRV